MEWMVQLMCMVRFLCRLWISNIQYHIHFSNCKVIHPPDWTPKRRPPFSLTFVGFLHRMNATWQVFFENAVVQLLMFSGLIYLGYILLMHEHIPTNSGGHKERLIQLVSFFVVAIGFGFCQEANRIKAKIQRSSSSNELLAEAAEEKKEPKTE